MYVTTENKLKLRVGMLISNPEGKDFPYYIVRKTVSKPHRLVSYVAL